MGYSIGHWDKDTFVVETIGQNGRTWLDMRGLPGTEALRVTERFSRPKIGHMDIEVTIDDPKAYTKPWTVKLAWRLIPDTDLIESICEENNRDPAHMVGKWKGKSCRARVFGVASFFCPRPHGNPRANRSSAPHGGTE